MRLPGLFGLLAAPAALIGHPVGPACALILTRLLFIMRFHLIDSLVHEKFPPDEWSGEVG